MDNSRKGKGVFHIFEKKGTLIDKIAYFCTCLKQEILSCLKQ